MLFRTYKGSRYRAAIVFILGFWMLDLANNTVQVSLVQILHVIGHARTISLSTLVLKFYCNIALHFNGYSPNIFVPL